MSVCGVVWYRCTQVPRPCPCHQTKPSSPPLLSSCHHLPPPQRNLEAAISSASSGLIHFSLRASSSPPSGPVVIPLCASPLYPLQPGPSHPHRHHLAARKPSEQPPLLAISQPAQPAHSPTSLSQPFAHQLPPTPTTNKSNARHRERTRRQSTNPIYSSEQRDPAIIHHPSSCTRAIEDTTHFSLPYNGTRHYAPWSWPKGCVEAHQRLCFASGPQRPGGRLLQACPRVDPVRGTPGARPLIDSHHPFGGVGPALLPATANSDPSPSVTQASMHARTHALFARSAVLVPTPDGQTPPARVGRVTVHYFKIASRHLH